MPNQLSIDDEFIRKVTVLIETNLANEQFGVNELSEEIGVSRSQLHRKLNSLTGKSTSQFIREYRLEKAMVMLQDNVATVSEIAYRVGFGSPTYFNSSFSDYYGYPPGEVKYRTVKPEEKETINSVSSTVSDSKIKKKLGSIKKERKFRRRQILILLGSILFIVLGYYALKSSGENKMGSAITNGVHEKSIAVLPFKNLSADPSNQYFADGMRDDIINHLSKIKDVVVKSRQSSDRYGVSDLSGLEIGEALGVNYIIDGSVQRYEGRIKVIVYLINAKNDTHLWSKDFDREFEDIFFLESEISRLIAKELDLVLSPAELEQIDKIPTKNLEAYNLYLKGHYFLYDFSGDGFQLAEKYFNQSIALDPEFALPYSGLALLHLYKGFPTLSEQDYLTAKDYALKAIKLDNSLAETHRALGLVYMEFEWKWEDAEKEFLRAVDIDPKNPGVLVTYARYLTYIKGDFVKAREFIDKALSIAPVSYYINILSSECYMLTEEYDKALEESKKAKEIDYKDGWASWINFLIYAKKGQDEKAVDELVENWSLNPSAKVNVSPMLEAFKKGGIDGVFRWINDLDINHANEEHVQHNAYWIAQKYAYLNEDEEAMKWLNIAFNRNNVELYRIKYDHFFNNLHQNPEFLKLLEKMNLGDYQQYKSYKD
ncbi:helix-turn-helix domain-containing protein [Aestuariivivens insulae]|uniref:helix-turn-helix domain-containing protein n=1 Tax=Aestuariivivens insulae TaxID=1621988 RepID=UPI001F56B777|nr:helix-turn-helix domain-containing protein [Aestuariivivens insulae]